MHNWLWLVGAWIGGTAAILGSLMTLGSLLLWLVPSQMSHGRKSAVQDAPQFWQRRLSLLVISVTIAFTGFAVLLAVPFPQG
ncbi:hypothetical protein H6F43_05835 [Leptolyngbya sp. FACHB-36]|uniref:hypothetical protein n=1 Tax=Leptolyngbya sp. FACHB-36 TaxID=2692808 RepID=UPI001681B564|nr:hypothetical protein [Leptolyngbya sp. FACHB-36]MBD2019708.1 hypothetical protein [Leptolyngbya sp. FACHB-36]